MKLYKTLESELLKSEDFADNGRLKKRVIVNMARDYDATLIELLLSHAELKAEFFADVNGKPMFRCEHFVWYVEQKSYLPDSYTGYKQEIGLTIDGKFLDKRNEVALVWPYKDCILEGGQTKEEQKRDEIFFNEILARDEITKLREPKVLTNAKRVSSTGAQPFTKFQRRDDDTISDNLLIKGNNLLALHSLKKQFAGKVKLIYIDPPYNTGGDANIFTYNNTFNHSSWLTFMRNRLTVARDFLTDDGFIAIAIDHNELFYLGVLADEVFGQENRIGVITVVHKPEGRNQEKFFGTSNEFMMIYAKNKLLAEFNRLIIDDDKKGKFDMKDDTGAYELIPFISKNHGQKGVDTSLRINKPSFWYPIYVSKDLKHFSLENKDDYIEVFPITNAGQERTWKTKSETFLDKVKSKHIVAIESDNQIQIFEKKYESQVYKTHWIGKKYNANIYGRKLLEKTLGYKPKFSYPKSLYSVLDTLKITTDKNDIVIDFQAGSATTGHAVLELNKQDGGNRQFILVEQLAEHIEVCEERLQKVIEQENLSADFVSLELKQYNEAFMERIQSAPDSAELLNIWQDMKERSFLDYNLDIKQQEATLDQFKQLDLALQKQHLCEILNKNQLYVNLSSLGDAKFACSDAEKRLTQDFYK